MRLISPTFRLATVLVLVAGACSISPSQVNAETETTASLRAEQPLAVELTLTRDALGPFSVGSDADTVILGVASVIGGWDADSNDDGSTIATPQCTRGAARVVSWGSLVLVFVADTDSEVFAGWSYGFDPVTANSQDLRGSNLVTSEGIGLGSTRSELVEAFGARVDITDAYDIGSATFTVDVSLDRHIVGKLDAPGASGVVDFMATDPTC